MTTDERVRVTAALLLECAQLRGCWISGDNRVGEADAAVLLGWSSDSLRNRRVEGSGPRWYRLGGREHRVSYRIIDIAEWVEQHFSEPEYHSTHTQAAGSKVSVEPELPHGIRSAR